MSWPQDLWSMLCGVRPDRRSTSEISSNLRQWAKVWGIAEQKLGESDDAFRARMKITKPHRDNTSAVLALVIIGVVVLFGLICAAVFAG